MSNDIQRLAQTNSIIKRYKNICVYCKEKMKHRMICYDCLSKEDIMEIVVIDNIEIYNKVLRNSID